MAAKPAKENSVDENRCSSAREEDRILCQASSEKDASIKQVVEEDETAQLEPEAPSSDQDVWASAYKQWIQGEKPKDAPKSAHKAMLEAMKRHPDAKLPEDAVKKDTELPELEDDELTLITRAAKTISDLKAEEVIGSLELIEDLCYSGDNGRQMAAAGGVPHLLRLAHSEATSILALKALATCAQNNPAVFDAAVEENAISVLLALHGHTKSVLPEILRALVAIADSKQAGPEMLADGDGIASITMDALITEEKESAVKHRAVRRSLALIESLLVKDVDSWTGRFGKDEFVTQAEKRLKSEDLDIREGAARVLQLLRTNI